MTVNNLLVPVKSFMPASGAFRWLGDVRLAPGADADKLPLGQLERDLALRLPRRGEGAVDVRVARDAGVGGAEAYRVTIRPAEIEVAASSDAGAYYGVQTLRAMLAAGGGGGGASGAGGPSGASSGGAAGDGGASGGGAAAAEIPCGVIEDWPDFPRRGVYLDCSRGKVPKLDTLRQLVERLAHWKVNELQLYVENVFTFRKHPAIGVGYSPFAPEEIIALKDHCRAHHIRLVGSLASFGHMERILELPAYRHLGEMAGFRGLTGGTTLCPLDEGSIALVADLYSEFVPLFDAVDFNVCCDETWELGKGRSQAEAQRVGLGRVYLDFLLKLRQLCGKYGKRMNAWADIVLEHPEMLAELPKDIVMLNWQYSANGPRIARSAEIADAHLPLVVCPGTSGWLSHGSRLTNAVANVANFAAEGRRCGAEGLLNTDWGDDGHRNPLGASLHGFAHGAAHSWHGVAVNDAMFTERFCHQYFCQCQGDERLANYMRLLGGTAEMIRSPSAYRVSLYRALVDPLAAPLGGPRLADAEAKDSIGQIPADGAWEVIERVGAALADVPSPDSQRDEFEKLALAELALAGRMDMLAARRAVAAAKLRTGQCPAAADLSALADETARVSEEFQSLWLARSKPSRLADNVAKLDAAIVESRCLAAGD
jgi:hypothetical protein